MADDIVPFGRPKHQDYAISLTTWRWGYKLLFLSEYYLATGDTSVLPAMKKFADWLCKGQMACGTWGHRSPWAGYGALNQAGLVALMALTLAREAGIEVDERAYQRAVDFFGDFVTHGGVPYGDHPPFGAMENQGKCAALSIIWRLLGKTEWARITASMTCLSYTEFEYTHAGCMFTWLWSPLGAMNSSREERRILFDQIRWYYELGRSYSGTFSTQPTPENLSGRTVSQTGGSHVFGMGALPMIYALPHRQLRILGRARSPVPDPARDAACRRDVELTIRAIRDNLEEGNVYLADQQIKALKRYRGDIPELRMLSVPKHNLETEEKAAGLYFEHYIKQWQYDYDRMRYTKAAAEVGDGFYPSLARKRLQLLPAPREFGRHKWERVFADDGTRSADGLTWEFTVPARLKRHLGLIVKAPENARVLFNGMPIAHLHSVRAEGRGGFRRCDIWLHPSVRELFAHGKNRLSIELPEGARCRPEMLSAELITADELAVKGDVK